MDSTENTDNTVNTNNTDNTGKTDNNKRLYILIAILVFLVGVLVHNNVSSNNTDNSINEEDTSNADTSNTDTSNTDVSNEDTKKNNVEVEKNNVEVENIDINDFKNNTLPNSDIEYSFLGAIDNNLYGIGKGFSGDGLKEKVIFYNYKEKNGLDITSYTPGDTINNDGVIVDMFSVHSMGDNVYSFVDYNGKGNSINEICSYDFNTKEEKLLKQVETNNEFVIYDAYVCSDDIYEFTHYKTGIDTISSEKMGLLQSYNANDYWISMCSDGDILYYSMSNLDTYNIQIFADDTMLCNFNVEDKILRMNNYGDYFVFETTDNIYVYNNLERTMQGIKNVTSNFIYDNKVYYTSNGDIMFYDLSKEIRENVATLDEDLYKIVGIDNDKVILHYEDADTSLQGLAVYSLDDNMLYKYSGLEGDVQIFYNDSYIIVVEKDFENNQLNKFEIKL